ncbi:hypothetical protein [Streptomyces sp. WMMC940]|uniref:hypothetical protein n=1 Tax=Streptomyces sp. WMMC940 TaxID=3015153 RepID=UPI0022B71C45|nr:hypothetical protein [Streptomyces sp. WMMC940]MCZ7461794.1 hypothetical protein [Streptomyces sp. WMMC940]
MDVTVLKGTEPITRLDDPGPHPVPLRPGDSARSVSVWRYSAVDAANPVPHITADAHVAGHSVFV